jgi:hypothetical protein
MTSGRPVAARDPVRRILWARGLRDFGDGLAAVLLPAYLVALGHGAAEVGAVATVALLGSASMTLGVGVAGARADPRLMLLRARAADFLPGRGLCLGSAAVGGSEYSRQHRPNGQGTIPVRSWPELAELSAAQAAAFLAGTLSRAPGDHE